MGPLPLLALLASCAGAFTTPRAFVGAPHARVAAPAAPAAASPRGAPARSVVVAAKTRAVAPAEEENGDENEVRKRLDALRKRAAVLLAVAFARVKLLALRARAYQLTPRGKRLTAVLAFLVVAAATRKPPKKRDLLPEVPWSGFLGALDRRGRVSELVVGANRYEFALDGVRSFAVPAILPNEIQTRLLDAGVTWRRARSRGPTAATALAWCVAAAYLTALGRVAKQMLGGGVGKVGRRASAGEAEAVVTFDEVAGIDAAKREVAELVSLSVGPAAAKYAAAGARAPRGVLLVGPPGTGKTLLARALAHSSRVPFISVSGSEFVEMFVGRGAARVRQLFARAAKLGSCVIFIDELDALGKARREANFAFGGANDEVEQTLNQLLASMDGVSPNKGTVVLAATNRLAVLDPALTRPGRFDRIVRVPPPDLGGREAILKVHAAKITLAPRADLGEVARDTRGLVGAELAAIINEAAIRAVRGGRSAVETRDLRAALDDFVASRGPVTGGMFAGKKDLPGN